jgi:hypothetical protein
MRMEITRRELAAALVALQAPPDETLVEAKGEVRRDIEQLRGLQLPMSAEPAFIFKP